MPSPKDKKNSGIKGWSEEDRPREKFLMHGKSVLSDAELLAILIGSGSPDESAVDLCRRLLKDHGQDLARCAALSISDLEEYHGIGRAKAVTILAALELAKRIKYTPSSDRLKISSSRQAFEILYRYMDGLDHEQAWILLLKRSNELIGARRIGQGGFSATVIDPKVVFRLALRESASGLIIAHNHPSGSLRPSQADIQLTQKLKKAASSLDFVFHDHLIIAENKYYSFADEGML